jgi:hypothetical protein
MLSEDAALAAHILAFAISFQYSFLSRIRTANAWQVLSHIDRFKKSLDINAACIVRLISKWVILLYPYVSSRSLDAALGHFRGQELRTKPLS